MLCNPLTHGQLSIPGAPHSGGVVVLACRPTIAKMSTLAAQSAGEKLVGMGEMMQE